MIKNQLVLFKELDDIRKNIYSLCIKANCPRYNKCRKTNSVCNNDSYSQQRTLIRNNGGDFPRFFIIRTELMNINYPLVITIARKMGGYSTEDLTQEGILGLCNAINKFDLSLGNQFSTFAVSYIRKHILDFIRDNNLVKLATRISYLSNVTDEAFDHMVQDRKYTHESITKEELLKEVLKLRKKKNMKFMPIRSNEVEGHLNRLKIQLKPYDVKSLEPHKFEYQEHPDSFYELLNVELEKDLDQKPIKVTEAIKLRFGLGKYDSPTPTSEIAAVLGVNQFSLDSKIKRFFNKD
jgi:RNA polymerase sigma factor (sigma-70 family)